MSSLDDMFGNGNENGEETQAEEMTAFEVIKNLEKSWMNELFSPGNISENINNNEFLPGCYTDLTSLKHAVVQICAPNHESIDFLIAFHL